MAKVLFGLTVIGALIAGMVPGEDVWFFYLVLIGVVFGIIRMWLSVEREDPARDRTMAILRETNNLRKEYSAALLADWNDLTGRKMEEDPIYAFDPAGVK